MTAKRCTPIPAECADRFARIETKLDMLLERQKTLGGRLWGLAKALGLLCFGAFVARIVGGKG